ncbi:MAG TPA: excinuclease ABC subunit C [Mollicutes bacterium]|nr:excinuclease ABC subunit C [Mollicutes bacterium]
MFKEELKLVPNKPGSYQMYNEENVIIYVGKAKDLKKRLSSYFRGKNTGKTAKMVSEIAYFKYIITFTELESFILELNLIKKYNPKYNVLLKDDKTYPYLEYTKKPFPKLKVVRYVKVKKHKDKLLFGPYVNAYAARRIANLINRLYPLKKCKGLPKEVCLYYHINECHGYCVKDIDKDVILKMEKEILSFLRGNDKIITDKLKEKLKFYSDNMNYEMALELKEELEYIEVILEKQKVQISSNINADFINYYYKDGYIGIEILFIRNGKLNGSFDDILFVPDDYKDELESFIALFYSKNEIPKEVYLPDVLNNEILKEVINTKFFTPERGQKKRLLEMAKENARDNVESNYEKNKNILKRTEGANEELSALLGINITRIDAFDNSNLFGSFSVSGMVVYKNGKPARKEYRKYKIKIDKNDDYNTMKEVIYRRYYRALMEKLEMPQLILVDGGKGQISAAMEVLQSLNLNIKVCGLAKDDKHSTSQLIDGDTLDAYNIDKTSTLFLYLTSIQNEVHRFTINYHKQIRSKGLISSILDDIKGIGPKRKNELIKAFGSINNIKNADLVELEKYLPSESALELKRKLEKNDY